MREHGTCDVCGGTLVQDTTSLQLWHEKQLVIISDVPAKVCRQCGQSHVSRETSAQIEKFLQNCVRCEPTRYIQVPEFSARQILRADS